VRAFINMCPSSSIIRSEEWGTEETQLAMASRVAGTLVSLLLLQLAAASQAVRRILESDTMAAVPCPLPAPNSGLAITSSPPRTGWMVRYQCSTYISLRSLSRILPSGLGHCIDSLYAFSFSLCDVHFIIVIKKSNPVSWSGILIHISINP